MSQTYKEQPCQPVPATSPLCCPVPGTSLASQHPRVYLQPDDDGKAVCPYCSACYQAV
jgi:uncharacterized Zn-finger protein